MNWSPTPSDAFLGDVQGTVLIGLKRGGGDTYTLQIRDDGIGLPDDFDIHRTKFPRSDISANPSTPAQGPISDELRRWHLVRYHLLRPVVDYLL